MSQKYAAFDESGTINAFYDSLDSPVPEGMTNVIEITFDQWLACISESGAWCVQNGELIPTPPLPDEQLLADARTAKTRALQGACALALRSGYLSTSLGTTHSYGSAATDQQNLVDSVASSLMPSLPGDWVTYLWTEAGADDWLYTSHTAAQVQQVHSDWMAFRQSQQQKLITLMQQTIEATTIEAVQAISW